MKKENRLIRLTFLWCTNDNNQNLVVSVRNGFDLSFSSTNKIAADNVSLSAAILFVQLFFSADRLAGLQISLFFFRFKSLFDSDSNAHASKSRRVPNSAVRDAKSHKIAKKFIITNNGQNVNF